MNAAVRDRLVPALASQPGFLGATNLENRESGHGMMLTFWETEGQAARIPETEAFAAALAAVLAVSTGERAPIGVWHVNVAELKAAETPSV
jgi:heme-degrading monooxygenase HmoA